MGIGKLREDDALLVRPSGFGIPRADLCAFQAVELDAAGDLQRIQTAPYPARPVIESELDLLPFPRNDEHTGQFLMDHGKHRRIQPADGVCGHYIGQMLHF